jgi:hypothetical protein
MTIGRKRMEREREEKKRDTFVVDIKNVRNVNESRIKREEDKA